MKSVADKTRYLSLGTDYLGVLNAELRGLKGYATMARELIQNADDAVGEGKKPATEIRFDVNDDALVVWNDSVFSDCGMQGDRECPWKANRGFRCDFHRFRTTAGSDKRGEAGTTGAFGIGFISVYQITDYPEIRSNGWHWAIDPSQPEERRISTASDALTVGTLLRLPWARDRSTAVRSALDLPPVADDQVEHVAMELAEELSEILLFLQRVRTITVRRNNKNMLVAKRTELGGAIYLEANNELTSWKVFKTDFDNEAASLRRQYEDQIEPKRKSGVTIVFPADEITVEGKLFATLPTDQFTSLPFHIDADFYPSPDRKRILFDDDYQGEWNKAAIDAAADLVNSIVPELPMLVAKDLVWPFLRKIYDASCNEFGRWDSCTEFDFWPRIVDAVRTSKLVLGIDDEWHEASDGLCFLQKEEEFDRRSIWLRDIGIVAIHPMLRTHRNVLLKVGVQDLSITQIAAKLKEVGLAVEVPADSAPACIRSREARDILADVISALDYQSPDPLKLCAIALTTANTLAPPGDIWLLPNDWHNVVNEVIPEQRLAGANPRSIQNLIKEPSLSQIVTSFESRSSTFFNEVWADNPSCVRDLISQLADRSSTLRNDATLQQRIVALPIWPSGTGVWPLDKLFVPGGFTDQLGLADILDAEIVSRHASFLHGTLGVVELSIHSYAARLVPEAFANSKLTDTQKDGLAKLLSDHLGELKGHDDVLNSLRKCEIVRCNDECFRRPGVVYFKSDIVEVILGETAVYVHDDSNPSYRDLLSWIGVRDLPRSTDIIARIRSIVSSPPSASSRGAIQSIMSGIGGMWKNQTEMYSELLDLKMLAWLPGDKDKAQWFKPSELFTTYQHYLFESQADFLDLRDQRMYGDFLQYLDIPGVPSTAQVVSHILYCSEQNRVVNKEVYARLEADIRSPDSGAWEYQISRLKKFPSIWLEGGLYALPSKCYWNEHKFGKYAYKLNEEFRHYTHLLGELGVREIPSSADAIGVIREI